MVGVKGGWTNLRFPVLKLLLTHCVSAARLYRKLTLVSDVPERRWEGLGRHPHLHRRSARRTGRLDGLDDLPGSAGGTQLFVQSGDGRAGDGHLTGPTTRVLTVGTDRGVQDEPRISEPRGVEARNRSMSRGGWSQETSRKHNGWLTFRLGRSGVTKD